MPSIVDMVDILERLESKALHIEPARCVKVRNRNASCTRCADACTSGAITVEGNSIDIDGEKCTGCGTCTAACPTQAIVCDKPSDEQLAEGLARSMDANGGAAAVICGRVAARKTADVDRVAEVLCLGRVDVPSLIGAAARGAQSIALIDGGCSTCKFRAAVPHIDATADEANALLEAWGSDVRVSRLDAVPQELAAHDREQATGGVSRRGFFTGVKSQAKNLATEAATYGIEKELGIAKEHATLRDTLKVGEDGCLPHGPIPRHEDLLESLFEMGEPDNVTIVSHQWGSVTMDPEKCDNCGVCATFCPTGALSKVLRDAPKKPGRPAAKGAKELECLEFRLSDCVGCGTCADVCIGRAITVSHDIEASRVLELEPVSMRGAKRKRGIGGAWRS